jgi:hypothetical protein
MLERLNAGSCVHVSSKEALEEVKRQLARARAIAALLDAKADDLGKARELVAKEWHHDPPPWTQIGVVDTEHCRAEQQRSFDQILGPLRAPLALVVLDQMEPGSRLVYPFGEQGHPSSASGPAGELQQIEKTLVCNQWLHGLGLGFSLACAGLAGYLLYDLLSAPKTTRSASEVNTVAAADARDVTATRLALAPGSLSASATGDDGRFNVAAPGAQVVGFEKGLVASVDATSGTRIADIVLARLLALLGFLGALLAISLKVARRESSAFFAERSRRARLEHARALFRAGETHEGYGLMDEITTVPHTKP